MLKNKNPMLWACAKEICKQKHEGKSFKNLRELKNFVRENKHLLPNTIEGYKVEI